MLQMRKVIKPIAYEKQATIPSGEPVTIFRRGYFAWITSLVHEGLSLKVTRDYITDLEDRGFLSKADNTRLNA